MLDQHASTDQVPTRGRTVGLMDRPGHVEIRGIDVVPATERHGGPRELFWVWLAANITYLYFVLGGVMILLGLTLVQSFVVVVLGNLYWLGVGWLAVSGPASGTPSVVVTRAQYGVRGNRVLSAGMGWVVAVAYEAVNLTLGSFAAYALLDRVGLHVDVAGKVVVLLTVAVATLAVSVYGHATIVRLSPVFTVVLAVTVTLLGGFVLGHADWGYRPPALHGVALIGALSVAFVVIASSPLSWLTGADYARYLPASVSRAKVVGYTAAGGFLPAVVVGGLGILAGTRIDMTDPQTAVAAIVPGWFYAPFLGVVVLSSLTNNVLTAYSSGLCLQAMGVRARRSHTVVVDGVVGVAIALYAVLHGDFFDTLNSILQLTVAFLGPSLAIYAVDVWLRRNRYDGAELHDESATSRYWFTHGVSPAGLWATVLGTGAALLTIDSALWEGPLARLLGDVDLSAVVGPLVAAVTYAAVFARQGHVGSTHRSISTVAR